MNPAMHARPCPAQARQRGATLITALLFLLIFGVLAAVTFRGSLTSVQAVSNMQWRAEALSAANEAVDSILSTADFGTNPANFTEQFNKNAFPVDVNGDGITDITVTLPAVKMDPSEAVAKAGPRCVRSEPIPSKELDVSKPDDVACMGSSGSPNSGLGVSSGGSTATVTQSPSLCSNVEWNFTVEAEDTVTKTKIQVSQGVGMRVPTTSVDTCS